MNGAIDHKGKGQDISMEAAAAYMRHALGLAQRGAGQVAPNPLVGAVLVAAGRIIGQGYHKKYGGPHAEIECLASVSPDDRPLVSQADMFVTLEPCAHFGKTPPCADRIIEEKIPRVWIGCRDPFPQVDGKGIEKLEKAGVKVHAGLLEQECIELNRRFFCFHNRKRPYIILKWAQTADGFIAARAEGASAGSRLLISNEWSNRIVHRWRSEEAAILVGWKTTLADNPQLTNRYWPAQQPVRVLIDRDLRVSSASNLYHSFPTLVYNQVNSGREAAAELVKWDGEKDVLSQVLDDLHQRGIQSVLVEGGAGIINSFIQAQYWDEARIITNEKLFLGSGLPAPMLPPATCKEEASWQGDRHITWRNPAFTNYL